MPPLRVLLHICPVCVVFGPGGSGRSPAVGPLLGGPGRGMALFSVPVHRKRLCAQSPWLCGLRLWDSPGGYPAKLLPIRLCGVLEDPGRGWYVAWPVSGRVTVLPDVLFTGISIFNRGSRYHPHDRGLSEVVQTDNRNCLTDYPVDI